MKKPTKRKPSAKPKPPTPEITEYQAIATLERIGYVFTAIKPKCDRLTTGINLRTGVTRQLVAVKLCAPIESKYGAAWAEHYAKKASSREHAAHITDMMQRAGDAINAASNAIARRLVSKTEIIERDYGRDGRAWMVDPPGGLHDSAVDALTWARRYRRGAAIVWVTVTPRGKAEAARAAAPAQVRRG